MLLEMQGKPGEDLRQATPRSAAASAASAALAELRAKAAEKAPAPAVGNSLPPVQPFEGLGMLSGESRAAQPVERREWSLHGAGEGGSAGGRGVGYDDGLREPGASRSGLDDDNLLRRLPREVIAFLRENRYWLLGALGVIALLGVAAKAFSRRI